MFVRVRACVRACKAGEGKGVREVGQNEARKGAAIVMDWRVARVDCVFLVLLPFVGSAFCRSFQQEQGLSHGRDAPRGSLDVIGQKQLSTHSVDFLKILYKDTVRASPSSFRRTI